MGRIAFGGRIEGKNLKRKLTALGSKSHSNSGHYSQNNAPGVWTFLANSSVLGVRVA
jgi:hypothetical protein